MTETTNYKTCHNHQHMKRTEYDSNVLILYTLIIITACHNKMQHSSMSVLVQILSNVVCRLAILVLFIPNIKTVFACHVHNS